MAIFLRTFAVRRICHCNSKKKHLKMWQNRKFEHIHLRQTNKHDVFFRSLSEIIIKCQFYTAYKIYIFWEYRVLDLCGNFVLARFHRDTFGSFVMALTAHEHLFSSLETFKKIETWTVRKRNLFSSAIFEAEPIGWVI